MLSQDIPGNRAHEKLAAAPPDVPVAVLGYASVRSTDPSDQRELRLQAAAIDRFCTHRGWELVDLINDIQPVTKRTSPGRPALIYAVQQLRGSETSCLVVAELRRLCGSIAELGAILEVMVRADARLISLAPAIDTATVLGRASVRVLMDVSDWELTRRAEMTSAARGKVTPLAGIGPELRSRIVRMRKTGMTLQAIADVLNDEEVPTARGGATWRPSSVQGALGYKRPGPWAEAGAVTSPRPKQRAPRR